MKLIGLLLFLTPLLSIAQSNEGLTDICYIENSEIVILGTSNVTDYSCKLFDLSNNSCIKISSTIYGKKIKLENAIITLDANGFNCDNELITRDFYKAIKGDEFPKIMVQFHEFTLVNEVADSPTQENVPYQLSINLAGETNNYSSKLKSLEVTQDQLTISGRVDLLMTDFNIVPPSALFGTIKTSNEISIDFLITFTFK